MTRQAKLKRIVEVLAMGVGNLQANNGAPWEAYACDHDPEDWEIIDGYGNHVVTIDHDPADNASCAKGVVGSVNLASEVADAFARRLSNPYATDAAIERAYALIEKSEQQS